VKTNFEKHVTGVNPVISYVISSHLWLEHLLVRCLHTSIPRPEALFRDRGVTFAILISLAEAHAVIERDFADVLRCVTPCGTSSRTGLRSSQQTQRSRTFSEPCGR
jgi:hypothetical protein